MTCALYDEVLPPARLSLSDVRKLDRQNPVTELSLEPELTSPPQPRLCAISTLRLTTTSPDRAFHVALYLL